MNTLTILWGIITTVFFLLAWFHIKMMRKKIRKFKAPTLADIRFGKDAEKLPISFWDKPLQELQKQLNKFVDNFNEDNKLIHLAQACGYIAAFLTSAVSLLLTL